MNWRERMREDWDRRAREDSERYIYARDSQADVADFARSGEANYNQLVRPFLPILLDGRPAGACRAVEIGCGIGRMTEWFARDFAFVEALDVAPAMIEGARRGLGQAGNIAFHVNDGAALAPVATASADLVFSYIVFQHIPSREAIGNYVREAARVLKDGGAFKFQLNGDQSPDYLAHERDTWLGETFSCDEAAALLDREGFSILAAEGAGTQYFVLTARKGAPPPERSYVLPGEPWAAPLLLNGFGAPVDASWRPMSARARVRLPGRGTRLYAGLYFWPESCRHRLTLAGHVFEVTTPGDRYFECPAGPGEIEIALDPAPAKPPAFRVLGLY
ncbi:MAG: class I SAM-dependent methyltransferase [Acidobacteria bacterium]|nr:class I SAM-dependent methyltransferase [Acidobacteriota bacterium]